MDDYYIYVPLGAGALAILIAAIQAVSLVKRSPGNATMIEISTAIDAGVRAFLRHYASRLALAGAVAFGLCFTAGSLWRDSGLKWRSCMAFLIGMVCSALAAWVGARIAAHGGSRAAEAARTGGIKGALKVALGVGVSASMTGIGLALLGLCAAYSIALGNRYHATILAAFAFGSALAALLARAACGIHAASCDIGADTITGGNSDFSENDTRNPAVIADHAGDLLTGVAGLMADIMDSLVSAVVAAMLLADLHRLPQRVVILPMLLVAAGLLCTLAGFVFIRLFARNDPRRALINGAWAATVLFLPAAAAVAWATGDVRIGGSGVTIGKWHILLAVLTGVAAGRLIAISSDYFTSIRFRPTRRVALACQSGPVLTAIQGQRVGMMSSVLPACVLAAAILVAHDQAGFLGIALAAVGIVATLGMSAALVACAPIADNACGIAEMARLDRSVREITDILDTVGNNISAIVRGLASGAAALAAVALILIFELMARGHTLHMTAGLLVGGAIPWFVAARISGAVGASAAALIAEARRQLQEIPGLAEGKGEPDWAQVNEIAVRRAMRAALVIAAILAVLPVAIGALFGLPLLAGMMAGALISGLTLGSQSANTGSTLDHAKKFIEEGLLGGQGSEAHDAARIGDQFGDALKGAVGPALNTVIKLLAIAALLAVPLLRAWSN